MEKLISRAYLVWGCLALFYFYQFILRLSPSVMMDDLMRDFSINATGFAVLASLTSISYALSQVPLGVFADRFGVRWCGLVFLSLCICGTFIYATAQCLWVAQVGRFIIGIGAAASFLSMSKAIREYFPEHRMGTMFGLTMMVGTIGALNGGMPLSFLVDLFGWRFSLLLLCVLGVLILGVLFQCLPHASKQQSPKRHSLTSLRADLMQVLKNRDCWAFAGVALGLYITIIVLGDLWGVSFVMKAHQVERPLAANVASFLFLGLCAGSFVIAWISDFFGKTKGVIVGCTLILLALLTLLFSPLKLSLPSLYMLFFLIGFFSGAEMLCFSEVCKVVPASLTGTAIGFVNTVVVLGGSLVQQLVGMVLDHVWNGTLSEEGVRFYSLGDYKTALSFIVPIVGLSLVASFLIREEPIWTPQRG